MTTKTLNESDLAQFYGTENWYRHGLFRKYMFTDGVKYMADAGGAYWLIDDIICPAACEKDLRGEPFQSWTLTVEGTRGKLVADDGNGRVLYEKDIAFTDFPLAGIKLFLADNVLMLTSEY